MPAFNSTCVPADSSYSLRPISVSFPPQPSSFTVASQAECSDLCSKNSSCNAALFDSNTSSCALFPILYTMATPSEMNNSAQVMFIKISVMGAGPSTSIVGIVIGCVAAGIVTFVIVGILLFWRRRRMQDRLAVLAQERFLQELSKLPPRFSYKELEIATDNFSKRLGRGGFGSVYEGEVSTPTGTMKVAVKRLDQAGLATSSAMDTQFKAEVATIGSVSHVNLVSLKGFCMEKSARLLVFEFMPKGSLDKWLSEARGDDSDVDTHFSESTPMGGSRSHPLSLPKVLNWERRCRIALDTARGLEYLHHQSAEHIVHCDVKPANILLDNEFHAKVGDFGLAKLMGSDSQSFAMTTLKGTRGYVAPEWLQHATITAKSDVFSYGVVLLELLTGRKCIDPEHGHLGAWVMKTIADGLGVEVNLNTTTALESLETSFLQQNIMDQNLSDEDIPEDVFKRILIVALACVQSEPGERPTMGLVVQMLEDIMGVSYGQPSLRLKNYSAHTATISTTDFSSSSVSRSAMSDLGQKRMEGR